MPFTPATFAVGNLFVYTSVRQRIDGLTDRQVLLVRVVSNDGWNAMWEIVARLVTENVLHEITEGGVAVHAQALNYMNNRPTKEPTVKEIDENFVQFCRGLTNKQLENVLLDEWKAHEHRDYPSAVAAATERGWSVKDGERLN